MIIVYCVQLFNLKKYLQLWYIVLMLIYDFYEGYFP